MFLRYAGEDKSITDCVAHRTRCGYYVTACLSGRRILSVIFAYFDNFPVVAIIITIKTWARANALKESEFRNKYLLGTLTSMVLALIIFIIYKLL